MKVLWSFKTMCWSMKHQWNRPYLNQSHKVSTQMCELHIKTKLLQPYQLQSTNNANTQSLHEHKQEIENNPTDLENLCPQTCLKRGRTWWFQRKLEALLIKVSKNERNYLTNFAAMSISNGYKIKLDSNFVFGAIIILLTYQSYVRRKFSHP